MEVVNTQRDVLRHIFKLMEPAEVAKSKVTTWTRLQRLVHWLAELILLAEASSTLPANCQTCDSLQLRAGRLQGVEGRAGGGAPAAGGVQAGVGPDQAGGGASEAQLLPPGLPGQLCAQAHLHAAGHADHAVCQV